MSQPTGREDLFELRLDPEVTLQKWPRSRHCGLGHATEEQRQAHSLTRRTPQKKLKRKVGVAWESPHSLDSLFPEIRICNS